MSIIDKIEIDGNEYDIGGSGGTTVVANPTLVGTEDALEGIQIGNTKYKIPQIPEDITGVWTQDTTMFIATIEDGDEVIYPND